MEKTSTFTLNGKPVPLWVGALMFIPVAGLFAVFITMLVAMWSAIGLGIMAMCFGTVVLTIPVGLVALSYRIVTGAWPSWFAVKNESMSIDD